MIRQCDVCSKQTHDYMVVRRYSFEEAISYDNYHCRYCALHSINTRGIDYSQDSRNMLRCYIAISYDRWGKLRSTEPSIYKEIAQDVALWHVARKGVMSGRLELIEEKKRLGVLLWKVKERLAFDSFREYTVAMPSSYLT